MIRALTTEYTDRRVNCSIAGLVDPSASLLAFPQSWSVTAGHIVGPTAFGYSPQLRSRLDACGFSQGPNEVVLHVHGLWMYPSLLARQLSQRSGAKRMVSPHGMLDPWALQYSRWKKRAATWAFEMKNLTTADCLHALCQSEVVGIRAFGTKKPIVVIPNGVDVSNYSNPPTRQVLESKFPALKNRRWVLFVSRLHPKKGLPHLLKAWSRVRRMVSGDWILVIAGPDELHHEMEMKTLATELGMKWSNGSVQTTENVQRPSSNFHSSTSIIFTGPLYGDEKYAALGGAELFVLPSFSEGFSMAILEAAASGLPVMLSPHCNFPELALAGGGIEVAPTVEGCEAGLLQMLSLSEAERRGMGASGRKLVARNYTWSTVAEKMVGVYRWLLGGGATPDSML